jgi:DNA (cytosine-5)-methyltransferase 1
MTRPLALDLFCGAGGASMGLYRAGFDVVGIDWRAQPRYPFMFIRGDALNPPADLTRFDFIWASPPCQDYSSLKTLSGAKRGRLIGPVREMLRRVGVPYVIENVMGAKADLIAPIRLCGTSFGLGVWRHRLFEMSSPPLFTPQCAHHLCRKPIDVTGKFGPIRSHPRIKPGGGSSRKPDNVKHAQEVMGIDWMNRVEMGQSIPPAYAEFIGRVAMDQMRVT